MSQLYVSLKHALRRGPIRRHSYTRYRRRLMKTFVTGVLFATGMATLLAQAPAGKDLLWAFPVLSAVIQKPPAPEIEGPQQVAGSTLRFTQQQIDSLTAPPDWFPEQHAPM